MYAEIVSIGEELLSSESETLDTNSVFITKQLGAIGIRVLYKTTVGDDERRITDVLKIALNRADLIITSGGLGPTVDDMTRQGVANAIGRGLEFQQALYDGIVAKFQRFGVRMPENNRVQAMLPVGAIPIDNPGGTAPGFIVEHAGRVIMSLPGVPREMKQMMELTVIPFLRERLGVHVIKTRLIRTAGIGESMIDEQIGHLEKLTNPTVGLNAHSGQTDIRITARTETEAEADALIAKVEAEVREKLGRHIFGVDKDPLEGAFVEALRRAGVRAAIAEIGTGDALRKRLEGYPGGADLIDLIDAGLLAELRSALYEQSGNPPADAKAETDQLAAAIREHTGDGLVIVVRAEENSMAISVTNGLETRGRLYGYSLAHGGAEWACGWGLSIGWSLLTQLAGQARG